MDDGLQIILPENFRVPRYMNGMWLDCRRRWSDGDMDLLAAACDMRTPYTMAANTLGRSPQILAHKARELRLVLPVEWRKLIHHYQKKEKRGPALQYPYIVKPDEKYNDLIAVNRLVSKAIPGREDVCQDIMLALWESRLTLDDLNGDPKAVRAFVRGFRKASFERGGYAESMDVTLYSADGDGKSKYEDARYQRTLVHESDKFIEDAMFGSGTTEDFADDVVEQISREEESLGVSAAFWMRAEIIR